MNIKSGHKYFQLYSCCVPVKGAVRSILCDLQRSDFIFIPNEFAEIFLQKGEVTIETLREIYTDYVNFEIEFDRLIKLLCEKEYGFYSQEPHCFSDLNETIHSASSISNVIIDIDYEITFDLRRFINEISSLLCHAVAIRIFSYKSLQELEDIVKAFGNSTIRSIELYVPFTNELSEKELLLNLMSNYPVCKNIVVYRSNRTERFKDHYHEIIYTDFDMNVNNCCGYISPHYFRVNNETFFESRKFNNCLNRKLSIDINGMICNCPSMPTKFGKYDNSKALIEILKLDSFRKLWEINKDEIEICKDCEFRYICHDCRAFTNDANNERSKPKYCDYDPYSAKWNKS